MNSIQILAQSHHRDGQLALARDQVQQVLVSVHIGRERIGVQDQRQSSWSIPSNSSAITRSIRLVSRWSSRRPPNALIQALSVVGPAAFCCKCCLMAFVKKSFKGIPCWAALDFARRK